MLLHKNKKMTCRKPASLLTVDELGKEIEKWG